MTPLSSTLRKTTSFADRRWSLAGILMLSLLCAATPAAAYIGPGAGFALGGSILFGLAGFLAMGMFDAMLMTGFRANVFFWIFMGLIMKYAYAISSRTKDEGPAE